MGWQLKRLRQCEKCPWKVSTDPRDIPGYDEERHRDLIETIAEPGALPDFENGHAAMICHEHTTESGVMCLGWLAQQAGPGNNLALRVALISCENARLVQLDGPQHERFEHTLPRDDE